MFNSTLVAHVVASLDKENSEMINSYADANSSKIYSAVVAFL